jgi:hypothetical protein
MAEGEAQGMSGRLRRRRHGSQSTGMAARVKSREAVRHFPQGFTRDDSPGEDECGGGGSLGEVGVAPW